MNKPHIHADLIKAWADGAEIQVLYSGTYWKDIFYPYWHEKVEYRIKPKTIKYRVGIVVHLNGEPSPMIATTHSAETYYEKLQHFVKWLGDWQEVEV